MWVKSDLVLYERAPLDPSLASWFPEGFPPFEEYIGVEDSI